MNSRHDAQGGGGNSTQGSAEQTRCVLFDHDDTLVSTFELRSAVLEMAVQEVLGSTVDGAALMHESLGQTLEQLSLTIVTGAPGAGAGSAGSADANALAARLVSVYRGHYYRESPARIRVYPGIRETLEGLCSRGLRLAVVTSKLGRGASAELEACELAAYFQVVVGAEDVRSPKPDREPFDKAMRALRAEARHTLMVGDAPGDIVGARAAGIRGAAALWGSRQPEALLSTGPDLQLSRPQQLLSLS